MVQLITLAICVTAFLRCLNIFKLVYLKSPSNKDVLIVMLLKIGHLAKLKLIIFLIIQVPLIKKVKSNF